MTLDQYLTSNGITEAAFATEIGADQSTVNRLRRKGQIPSKELMAAIFEKSGGAVRADDFFGIGPADDTADAA
jgi:transcriptional regulator with XRE-family HTH domain